MQREAQKILDGQVKKIEGLGATVAEAHLREGSTYEEIVALATEIGVGLIAVGSRGRGRIRRLLVGSISDAVVRDRKSTRLNSSHANISYDVFCLKKKNNL